MLANAERYTHISLFTHFNHAHKTNEKVKVALNEFKLSLCINGRFNLW